MTESENAPALSTVVSGGDHRLSLIAIRDRLAFEADDTRRAQHKRVCHCECGIGDDTRLVAILKELRVVLADLSSMPVGGEESTVDKLAARIAATHDELAAKRRTQARVADAAGP